MKRFKKSSEQLPFVLRYRLLRLHCLIEKALKDDSIFVVGLMPSLLSVFSFMWFHYLYLSYFDRSRYRSYCEKLDSFDDSINF